MSSFRLDRIVSVEPGEPRADYDELRAELDRMAPHLWGVSTHGRSGARLEHVEFTVRYEDDEPFIHQRLEREKRNGYVEQVDEDHWKYTVWVSDALELLPWLRTFTGRITELKCTNRELTERWEPDLAAMKTMYGGDTPDVS